MVSCCHPRGGRGGGDRNSGEGSPDGFWTKRGRMCPRREGICRALVIL